VSVAALGYLGFAASDPAAWEPFATRFLGLAPAEPTQGAARYRADGLAWRFAVAEGPEDDLAYVGFEVSGPDELSVLAARLEAAGVALASSDPALIAERGVLDLMIAHDPEGLRIEIFHGPTQRAEAPFVSPVGAGPFLTGDQGLGHIVLATARIDEARRFYRDLLGFRLSDVIRMRISPELALDLEFFHCNGRHHTLALVPLPGPRPAKRLLHFMLQASSLDDVGLALERAESGGVVVTQTLGRHTNDQMVSFYARTPSGFEVEVGYGALTVDDASWRVSRHDKTSIWGHKSVAGH
jgi:2,3-dihydroxybiphenyl 1,2-dioxygenase